MTLGQTKFNVKVPALSVEDTSSNNSPVKLAARQSDIQNWPNPETKTRKIVVNRTSFNISPEMP